MTEKELYALVYRERNGDPRRLAAEAWHPVPPRHGFAGPRPIPPQEARRNYYLLASEVGEWERRHNQEAAA